MDAPPELDEILTACFEDVASLRRFLGRRYGRDVERELPGEAAPEAAVFAAAVRALEQRRLVDAELLGQLRAHARATRSGLEGRIDELARHLRLTPLPALPARRLGASPQIPWAISIVLPMLLGVLAVELRGSAPRPAWIVLLGGWALAGALAWIVSYAAPEQARRLAVTLDSLARWLQCAGVGEVIDLADRLLSRVYGPVVLGPTALWRVVALSLVAPAVVLFLPRMAGFDARPALPGVVLLLACNVVADLLSQAHTQQLLREIRPQATLPRLAGVLIVDALLVGALAWLPAWMAIAPAAASTIDWARPAALIALLGADPPARLLAWTAATAGLPSLVLCFVLALALLAKPRQGMLLRGPGRLVEVISQDRDGLLGVVYPGATVLLSFLSLATG